MSAATHKGHCQICGNLQKLPSGKLAKHGYTTRWGFFSGTCNGAGFLPFEQSTDRIEAAIAAARNRALGLRGQAIAVEDTTSAVWVLERKPATWERGNRHGAQAWRLIPVEELTYAHNADGECIEVAGYVNSFTGRKERLDCHYGETVVSASNKRYAQTLRSEAAQFEEYVAWQTERIAGWAPAELLPL